MLLLVLPFWLLLLLREGKRWGEGGREERKIYLLRMSYNMQMKISL